MTGSALYLFPSDIVDEGLPRIKERMSELGTTVVLAMAYHQARDLVPHAGAKPRLRYREDGIFFDEPLEWPSRDLTPPLQSTAERDAAESLRRSAAEGSLEAWTVFLHNTTLGTRRPDLSSQTCFGDALLSNLCPSQPLIAEYAIRLAGAVAERGYDVVAEALSGQTFAHGHHHERAFTPLGQGEQAILGICFCSACESRGVAAGIEVTELRRACCAHVQNALATETQIPATREALEGAIGSQVIDYLAAGTKAVTDLTRRVAETVHARGRRISFMDLTGAVLGYETGEPTGPDAADQSWRLRIDPSAIAEFVDSYSVLGYVRDPERLRTDISSYRKKTEGIPLRVILRPGFPDAQSEEELRLHIEAVRAAGADQIDFYNYGMYDHAILDRIPRAMS